MIPKRTVRVWTPSTLRVRVQLRCPPSGDPWLYVRIHAILARKIREGQYPDGTNLPSEAELGEEGSPCSTRAR